MVSSARRLRKRLSSLFREQLRESAARGLDDGAREELDFQLVEKGHTEAHTIIQQDFNNRILRRVEALQSGEVTPINSGNTGASLEEYHAPVHNTVVTVMTPISERLDTQEPIRTRTSHLPPTDIAGLVPY